MNAEQILRKVTADAERVAAQADRAWAAADLACWAEKKASDEYRELKRLADLARADANYEPNGINESEAACAEKIANSAEYYRRKTEEAAERAQEYAIEVNYSPLTPDEADANADKAEHAAEEAVYWAVQIRATANHSGEYEQPTAKDLAQAARALDAEHAAEEAEKIATRAEDLAGDEGEEAEHWAAEADDAKKQAAEAAKAGNATAARQHCADAKHALRQIELIAD